MTAPENDEREAGREPSRFDQTLAQIRSRFPDLSPDELEALIAEAVTAVRTKTATAATSQTEAREPGHMRHEDFRIGSIFWCGGRRWRCTDIGTRVVTAICLDRVEVASTSPEQRRTLGPAEAEAEGWFNGPPYAVNETVFDEYNIDGCSLEPDPDDADAPAPGAGTGTQP